MSEIKPNGNGTTTDDFGEPPRYVPPPQRSVTFDLGSEQIEIHELNWYVLEEKVLPLFDKIGGENTARLSDLRIREAAISALMQAGSTDSSLAAELEQNRQQQTNLLPKWYVSRGSDIKILAEVIAYEYPNRTDLAYDEIRKRLTLDGSRKISERMVDLLRISGFQLGEAEAAGDSTETSKSSSPNSSVEAQPE